MQLSRRQFFTLGSLALLAGCDGTTRYKHRGQDLPGKHAKNKNRKDNRKYPCGYAVPEYTVVTTPRYTVTVNGRDKKVNKVFILCGEANANAWKAQHPLDLVYRSG